MVALHRVRSHGLLRAWQVYLGLTLAPIAVYYALDEVPQAIVFDGLSLAAGLAVLLAIGLRRPGPRLPWLLLAAGQLCWFVGDTIWNVLEIGLHEQPFPSVADAFYLAGYPLIAIGLSMLLGKRQGRPDWAALCDGAILATGVGLVVWVALIDPLVTDPTLGFVERAASIAYPLGDILLLAVLVRILVTPGMGTTAFRLFALSLAASFAGDILFAALALDHSSASPTDAVFLAGYALWGAAALHPSMAASPEPGIDRDPRPSAARFVGLALAAMVGPAVLLLQYAAGQPIDAPAIAAGFVLIVVLVMARIGGLVGQLTRSLGERRDLEMRLRHQAFHDPLTGLPNRALLTERLGHALARRDGIIGLLFLDLDDFKAINDTLGHDAGDLVLVEIARRLQHAIRRGDTAARIGGDEYAILLEEIADEAEPLIVGGRVLDALRPPFIGPGVERIVHASVGLALAHVGESDPDEVLRNADLAMYRAKSAGGNRLELYDPAMHQALLRRVALQTDLARAVEREQIVVHFQPVFDLSSRSLVALEALARWRHPERGLLAPGEFIGLAEETGLIVPLGRLVLDLACRSFQGWRAEGLISTDIRLHVNISARQLRDEGLAADLRRTLRASRLDPSSLVLELTESVLVDEPMIEQGATAALRALGIGLSLDDFGTGYASLGNLARFRVDELKIDRSFVAGLGRDEHAEALCSAVLTLGRALELRVVAEGIEDADQLERLKALGCRLGQGYLLGRPLAAPELTAWLRRVARDPAADRQAPAPLPAVQSP